MTHGNPVVRCFGRAALSLGGLWLASCMASVPAPKAQELPDTNWTLSALDGKPLLAGSSITLSFASGRVQGTDGCNRYSGPYTASGLALVIGPEVVATMMGCEPELMQQASTYMQALMSARGYRVEGGELQLLDAAGKLLARLTAPTRELALGLAGTSWRVTGFNNGRQAVVSALLGTTLTAGFSEDGRVSGTAGCNHYSAAYTSAGTKISFAPAVTTRMMCPKPEGIMEQEQQFLGAVAMAGTFRMEGGRLELRAADGALALTLTRESTPE